MIGSRNAFEQFKLRSSPAGLACCHLQCLLGRTDAGYKYCTTETSRGTDFAFLPRLLAASLRKEAAVRNPSCIFLVLPSSPTIDIVSHNTATQLPLPNSRKRRIWEQQESSMYQRMAVDMTFVLQQWYSRKIWSSLRS